MNELCVLFEFSVFGHAMDPDKEYERQRMEGILILTPLRL